MRLELSSEREHGNLDRFQTLGSVARCSLQVLVVLPAACASGALRGSENVV